MAKANSHNTDKEALERRPTSCMLKVNTVRSLKTCIATRPIATMSSQIALLCLSQRERNRAKSDTFASNPGGVFGSAGCSGTNASDAKLYKALNSKQCERSVVQER